MTLQERYLEQGAVLAPDGIPLHFGDVAGEFAAALQNGVLLDRSHEGRLLLTGRDAADLVNRLSTNNTLNLAPGAGRPTVFVNANARILERVDMFHWKTGEMLLIGTPGNGAALHNFLKSNIFYSDQVSAQLLNEQTFQFAVHGQKAVEALTRIDSAIANLSIHQGLLTELDGHQIFVARLKAIVDDHYVVIGERDNAEMVWGRLFEPCNAHGLVPSGGIAFNALRIRAGVPGAGRELSTEYIPLEVGLWDEISFNKGCYTGQEIIARMESRERLARILVRLHPEGALDSPQSLMADGKTVGMVTSSVTAPDGQNYAMGVVKLAYAKHGTQLLGQKDSTPVHVGLVAGIQPTYVDELSD